MSLDWRSRTLGEGVVLRLLLMRHGEPVASTKGRCYGTLDVSLSAPGREQVSRVAEHLKGIPLSVIYASPRTRALESAQILADETGAALAVDPRLAEVDFGDLEGRSYAEIEQTMPEFFAEWMRTPTRVQFPGGESYRTLCDRVRNAIREIKVKHTREIVTIVAHGGVIRAALAEDLGLDASSMFRIDQSYAAVTCLDYYGDTPVVRTVNWLP